MFGQFQKLAGSNEPPEAQLARAARRFLLSRKHRPGKALPPGSTAPET